MSAIVCGKRSNSIFDELPLASPQVSKRIRRSLGSSSPTAAVRFSPTRLSSHTPSFDHSASNGTNYAGSLACLRSLFPDMDQQIIERALEASDNDLDSAIKSLNDLRLESAEMNSGFSAGITNNSGMDAASENQSTTDNLPKDGSEWVDLFVGEMMNATDVDDARARATRVLEVLEKSIVEHAGTEATENFHKENTTLKEQVELLFQENTLLKRAVSIQHERQKAYDERSHELQHLKQLVSQYQEQVRTLEVNNYALTMHLRQSQKNSSIPGHFHPDIF